MAKKTTEDDILKAATKVFLRKGLNGARMQEIADEAGINKALLHYYFVNKEKLFGKVFEQIIREIFTGIREQFSEEGDVRTIVQSFINNYIDRLQRHSVLSRFIIWELDSGAKNIARVFHEVMNVNALDQLPVFKIYNEAIRRGEIRPIPPIHLVLNIVSMCIYPFIAKPVLEQFFPGMKVQSPEFLEARKQVIFDCIWNGIANPDHTGGETV